MASRSILTLKMQRIQLSKIVGLSRMALQVLKWKCPVARMEREWEMMLTALVATETTGPLDVSGYQTDVHESYSIELKLHTQLNWILLYLARIRRLQASSAERCLLHERWACTLIQLIMRPAPSSASPVQEQDISAAWDTEIPEAAQQLTSSCKLRQSLRGTVACFASWLT